MNIVSQPARPFRFLMHAALALLVLAASAHCAWESHHELAGSLAALAHRQSATPLPLAPPHGCNNESGCLCRGATQARSLDVSHLADEGTRDLLAYAQTPLPPSCLLSARQLDLRHVSNFPPKISGRRLRALYASLLI